MAESEDKGPRVEKSRLEQEVSLLREEIGIKDARMGQIAAVRRPHYPPTERMAILELRAARGWSLNSDPSRERDPQIPCLR